MTASEFTFLAMGLILGLAAGAALVEVLRARPPAPREVRVTVAQDAIPRRAATLADGRMVAAVAEPARGGPADRREHELTPVAGAPERRTSVPIVSPIAIGVAVSAQGSRGSDRPIAVPVHGGSDPVLGALRYSVAVATAGDAVDAGSTTATMGMRPSSAPVSAQAMTAVLDRPEATVSEGGSPGVDPGSEPVDAASPAPGSEPAASDGPCGQLRRLSDERCELATLARAQAVIAEEDQRAKQRSLDDHEAQAEQAAETSDARLVRGAKEAAQKRFRLARTGATTTEDVEEAARQWLQQINQINMAQRDAAAALLRERETVRVLTLELERLAIATDAARITAETAEAACLSARQAVAECEEGAAGPVAHMPVVPPGRRDDDGTDDEPVALALGGSPRIFRLVRGDRSAMTELVAAMAGDDETERRRWQLALSDLVDAILADSIANVSLEFPPDHPFWGPFDREQNRDIVRALASLGYRFDGLGGWEDGRIPSQRDLSLALGYAGLDPMRIRHWPNEAEMAELNRDLVVAADERLAGAAGDLTLGELVTMLGRRADSLTEVWNEWGRLRPLLLEGG